MCIDGRERDRGVAQKTSPGIAKMYRRAHMAFKTVWHKEEKEEPDIRLRTQDEGLTDS